jgi:D-alanyl-D-alanine carboxypeptidase
MKKNIITLMLLGGLCIGHLVKAQIPTFTANRLQTVLDSVCTKYKIKGASAAVLVPGVGVWKGTSGISETGVPLTTDMLFGMGSNTKIHMSATLLKLQQEGMLDLDDSIGKWIQGYPNINGKITIRQCLNHTSGLFDYMQNEAINDSIFNHPSKIWTMDEILLLADTPNFAPGTSWDYSNTNYIIAGIIIREVMHQPVSVSLHDVLLAPNDLNNTFFYGDQPSSAVIPHAWTVALAGAGGNMVDLNTTPFLDNLFSLASTAGALMTTAEENVNFWHKMMTGQMLTPASMNELLAYINLGGTTNHKIGYGLGIFRYQNYINNRTVYTHGGTFFGFIAENMVDSVNGTCVSVLSNQDSLANDVLQKRVVTALHKVTLQTITTGIEDNVYNSSAVYMYPNPATDLITIQTENNEGELSLVVIDITGKQQLTEKVRGDKNTVSISGLQPGFYFAQLMNSAGQRVYTQKIQVIR